MDEDQAQELIEAVESLTKEVSRLADVLLDVYTVMATIQQKLKEG